MRRAASLSGFVPAALLLLILALVSVRPAHAGSAHPGPACVPVSSLMTQPDASEPVRSGQDNKSDQSAATTSASATSSPASTQVGQDVCVAAHVYQVVELADGTRFLDVCPAAVPDEDCRFILLSRSADRKEAGDLRRLAGGEVHVRGTLRRVNGRFGIFITHARQLDGGPEKFRPNPRLLQEFDPDSDRLPVRDPNLRASGRRRTFMNRTLKVPPGP